MRSCTGRIRSLGDVVRMAHVSSAAPSLPPCQQSQRPAKAKAWPSALRKYHGCFFWPAPCCCHSNQPSARTRQRRLRKGTRKAGLSGAVADRALVKPALLYLDQDGTNPHRSVTSPSTPSASARTEVTDCDGAML